MSRCKLELLIALSAAVDLLGNSWGAFTPEANYLSPKIFGAVRLLRAVRLAELSSRLGNLINTVLFSLGALYNIGFLLLVIVFVYSVMGMNLFPDVEFGEFINDDNNNFHSFLSSFLLLFRCATGENWNGIMREAAIQEPFCSSTSTANTCGSPSQSYLYFISFELICAFLLLNMVVAVVFKNFEQEFSSANNQSNNKTDGPQLEDDAPSCCIRLILTIFPCRGTLFRHPLSLLYNFDTI